MRLHYMRLMLLSSCSGWRSISVQRSWSLVLGSVFCAADWSYLRNCMAEPKVRGAVAPLQPLGLGSNVVNLVSKPGLELCSRIWSSTSSKHMMTAVKV